MNKLKISVVVPFYNTPISYFQKCINALKKLNPYEVILVDDCSNDENTIKLAKSSGFKYLKTPYQSGHDGMPLNIGVKEAKREIFLKYSFSQDSNVFGDVLFVLQILYNRHSFEVFKKINYIYRKRENSVQTSKPYFYHRLRNIQTVARLCQLENILQNESLRLLKLAMLNVEYGTKSIKYLNSEKL